MEIPSSGGRTTLNVSARHSQPGVARWSFGFRESSPYLLPAPPPSSAWRRQLPLVLPPRRGDPPLGPPAQLGIHLAPVQVKRASSSTRTQSGWSSHGCQMVARASATAVGASAASRSEEQTSELQSLKSNTYAV